VDGLALVRTTSLIRSSPGAFAISTVLPLLCYIFAFLCNEHSGCPSSSLLHPKSLTLEKLKADVGWPGFSGLINTQAALATLGYYTLSLTLNRVLPAQEVEGVELNCGGKLKYRLNGMLQSTS
jgi:Delta14-sterol reductase